MLIKMKFFCGFIVGALAASLAWALYTIWPMLPYMSIGICEKGEFPCINVTYKGGF